MAHESIKLSDVANHEIAEILKRHDAVVFTGSDGTPYAVVLTPQTFNFIHAMTELAATVAGRRGTNRKTVTLAEFERNKKRNKK